jgi:hypothetical protein
LITVGVVVTLKIVDVNKNIVHHNCEFHGMMVPEMYWGPYSAGVLHSVSDQIQDLQNCFTTPNKMTSEDDIMGLVSLKFLRPWGR